MTSFRTASIAGARFLVTGALLVALAARVDFGHTGSLLANASPPDLAASVIMLFAAVTVSVLRWHIILATQAPSPGLGALLKLTFTGVFFNQVLPTGIGGDAVRAWRCRNFGIDLPIAIRSVLLDRISGYVIIVAIYALSLPLLLRNFNGARESLIIVLFLGSVGAVAAFSAADLLPDRVRRLPVIRAVAALSFHGRSLFGQPWQAGIILGSSALATILTTVACMLTGRSVGAGASLVAWLAIIGPITLIQLIPVSLAGWGVREIGLVAALPVFGVSPEAALATSLLIGLCMIAIALPGGLIWLTGFDLPRTKPTVAGNSADG